MLKRIKLRIQDMKTISQLITGADEAANNLGEEDPGAEHFVLSALKLSDGSAERVFNRVGADSAAYRVAIVKQYNDALESMGINSNVVETVPIETKKRVQRSKPSGQEVMKLLYAAKKSDRDRPILGAHIMGVIATMEHGTAVRAFRVMGIDTRVLAQAAQDELDAA